MEYWLPAMVTRPVSGALAVRYIVQVELGGTTLRSETFIVAVMTGPWLESCEV